MVHHWQLQTKGEQWLQGSPDERAADIQTATETRYQAPKVDAPQVGSERLNPKPGTLQQSERKSRTEACQRGIVLPSW